MKTLNNLFGKNSVVKNINEFRNFSLSESQMNLIKGGSATEPINTLAGSNLEDKIFNNI